MYETRASIDPVHEYGFRERFFDIQPCCQCSKYMAYVIKLEMSKASKSKTIITIEFGCGKWMDESKNIISVAVSLNSIHNELGYLWRPLGENGVMRVVVRTAEQRRIQLDTWYHRWFVVN